MVTRTEQRTATEEVTTQELALALYNRKGCAFLSIEAEYDLEKGDKMKKRNNPWIGKGLRKVSKTSVMVTFDYEASMERRGDQASGTGNWSMALTREDGSLTPLSVHKKDIIGPGDWTTLTPMKLAPDARVYLRGEFRDSNSRYVLPDGTEVDKEEVKPHLKKQSKTGAVNFHTVSLKNVKKLTVDGVTYVVKAA